MGTYVSGARCGVRGAMRCGRRNQDVLHSAHEDSPGTIWPSWCAGDEGARSSSIVGRCMSCCGHVQSTYMRGPRHPCRWVRRNPTTYSSRQRTLPLTTYVNTVYWTDACPTRHPAFPDYRCLRPARAARVPGTAPRCWRTAGRPGRSASGQEQGQEGREGRGPAPPRPPAPRTTPTAAAACGSGTACGGWRETKMVSQSKQVRVGPV